MNGEHDIKARAEFSAENTHRVHPYPAGGSRIPRQTGRWQTLEPRLRLHINPPPLVSLRTAGLMARATPLMLPTAALPVRSYSPASPLAQPCKRWREMVADLLAGLDWLAPGVARHQYLCTASAIWGCFRR